MSTSPKQKARVGAGRVLPDLSHGGHVIDDKAAGAAELARTQHSIVTAYTAGVTDPLDDSTPFGYLFDALADEWPDAHLPTDDPSMVVAALMELGAAMVEDPPPSLDPLQGANNSTIPPIYTYFGQFIDHDMTANTDRDSTTSDITASPFVPRDPRYVAEHLRNLRDPALSLDSLYGDGPAFDAAASTAAAAFYDGIKLRVGKVAEAGKEGERPLRGDRIPPDGDLARDLPRDGSGKALIGDGRNDENLIIAQLHTAFLRFHNAVVDWVEEHEPMHDTAAARFARAKQLVQWHYQWLVVHDFLKTVTMTGIADKVLLADDEDRLYQPNGGDVYMPLEYSVAAYRFGHSMIRAVYDYNRNFGRPGTVLPSAPFELLFLFTGKADPPFGGATDVLPFNWVVEWDRMVDKGAHLPDRFARKIDTNLAPPMRDLSNEGNGAAPPMRLILKRLATRNLLRGYLLAIPTGQKVAEAMGLQPLSRAELEQDNHVAVNEALEAGGFIERTPLWYYVLKEAEVRANGNSLGPIGSRIVCETIIGQLRHDETSYLRQPGGWDPHDGVRLPDGSPIVSIADLLRFAGVLS